jgi:hypothetical protein
MVPSNQRWAPTNAWGEGRPTTYVFAVSTGLWDGRQELTVMGETQGPTKQLQFSV